MCCVMYSALHHNHWQVATCDNRRRGAAVVQATHRKSPQPSGLSDSHASHVAAGPELYSVQAAHVQRGRGGNSRSPPVLGRSVISARSLHGSRARMAGKQASSGSHVRTCNACANSSAQLSSAQLSSAQLSSAQLTAQQAMRPHTRTGSTCTDCKQGRGLMAAAGSWARAVTWKACT